MMEQAKFMLKNTPILKHLVFLVCQMRTLRATWNFQKNAYLLYDEIFDALSREKIAFFSLFGTLLGNVRERGLIKHDNDFDFGVVFSSNLKWKKLYETLISQGFSLSCFYTENNLVSEMVFQKKGIYVDFFNCIPIKNCNRIYFYYRKPNKFYPSTHVSTAYVDTNISSTIIQYVINDRIFYCPQNYDLILTDLYGPNWNIPIKEINTTSQCGKRIYDDDLINTIHPAKTFTDFINLHE